MYESAVARLWRRDVEAWIEQLEKADTRDWSEEEAGEWIQNYGWKIARDMKGYFRELDASKADAAQPASPERPEEPSAS